MSDKLKNFGYCKIHNAYFDKDIGYCIFCKTEALEKKFESLKPFKTNDIELLFKTREQIAELKEDFKKFKHDTGKMVMRDDNKINELKEDLKASLDYTTGWAKEFMNAEEVLREFPKFMDSLATYFASKYEKEIALTIREHIKRIRENLEKLDSPKVGSASARESLDRQTEKKEEYFCENHYLDDNGNCHYCNYKKDSGGEKLRVNGVSGQSSVNRPNSGDDSILPEFQDLKDYTPEPKPSMICGDGPEPRPKTEPEKFDLREFINIAYDLAQPRKTKGLEDVIIIEFNKDNDTDYILVKRDHDKELIEDFIKRLESYEFMEGDDILTEIQYWKGRLKE